ncbi:MAG: HAMP domain-containing protein [Bryobacterales bacterium]|nr:HAMP domain-containing protein [Bryobacterales bacterium]
MDQHSFLVRPHLWWLATVLILTYLLARHLTQPLRALQVVARKLGQGDLRARAEDDRKDEFGQLARTINQMAERMETLVESERRLLRDVSHELRSPLARLGVAVELARTSDNPARELDLIENQATRLNELVGTLLEVARAESAPHTLHREPVALKPVLEDLAAEARLEAGSKRILLDAQEITVPADVELLRRAVENVLRNAVRYTRDDGTVSVRLARASHAAEVTIRDEGPGVPEDLLPRLFEPFFRVEGQHGTGFGLGLSIARRAVAAHGGSVRARNTHPGLEVTLAFPFE